MAKSLPRYSLLSRRSIATLAATPRGIGTTVMEGLWYRASGRTAARNTRDFSSSNRLKNSQHSEENSYERPPKKTFGSRLRVALRRTKMLWFPIPIGLGFGLVGLFQLYKRGSRQQRENESDESDSLENEKRPRRHRIRPSGPWSVQIMSTLPLKLISRLWGRINEIELPYFLRAPGFRLYAWIFGVKLDEVADPDLCNYPNLAAFFYRQLKPGVRPLDPDPHAVLSPADGRILQFGTIERGEVEQVKGVTYSLDALLGVATPQNADHRKRFRDHRRESTKQDAASMAADEEFARVNNISYTLPSLLSGKTNAQPEKVASLDVSTESKKSSESEVKADLARGDDGSWYAPKTASKNALYYVVVYLAPGDYHRFHSPAPWVVESRRHFAGELYSVSPYLQQHLPGLFTLNERVALLGRWRWGFFGFIPVGATNVGSIKINFDAELRTNSFLTDTAADRAAALASARGEPYHGYVEATYSHASETLGGHALDRGEEMGGFQLGSSIVLVFEAPIGKRSSFDVGWKDGEREGGWNWAIKKGQRIQVGEKLGYVDV